VPCVTGENTRILGEPSDRLIKLVRRILGKKDYE